MRIAQKIKHLRDWVVMEDKVHNTLIKTDWSNPGKNPDFDRYVPYMHWYGSAMENISRHTIVCRRYAEVILAHYNNILPYEVEKTVISQKETYLIHHLTELGHKWSPKAQKLMQKRHPGTYKTQIALKM